jgi:hypothetical protein
VSDTPQPYDKVLHAATGIKFADMTHRQKWIFSVKLVCCICTMGFAFPNVQND